MSVYPMSMSSMNREIPADLVERRAALATFLRSRRERLTPVQVGLPTGGRRRTPGLRREEVAQLAGVSPSWYTWLEQGRNINVSGQVLESLARVFQLGPDERRHLYSLAREPERIDPLASELQAPPALRYVLDALEPAPAYIISAFCHVLAQNNAAHGVLADWERRKGRENNLIWWIFTDLAARELFVDWEGEAQRTLAFFRANSARYIGQAWFSTLVNDLCAASAEFRVWWPQQDVCSVFTERKELRHTQLGTLVFHPIVLQPATMVDHHLVVYTPLPEAQTAEKLDLWWNRKNQRG
jgi:transcriptional regulator with XRE-family HTH domain